MLRLMPRVTAVRLAATLTGAFSMIRWASFSASEINFDFKTTRLTRPDCRASSAVMGSPVRIISNARLRPIRRGRRWVPPNGGGKPRLISGLAKVALSAATASGMASSISQPPPKAKPLTAPMMGLGKRSMREVKAWPRATKSRSAISTPAATEWENSLMSAPALKARSPAPVTITARTVSSRSMASR